MINFDAMPPDWQFAARHAQACRPGIIHSSQQNNNENIICPCCLKVVNKQKCSLLQNSKELQFLGFGIPLYFIFIKYCIVLIFVLITSYNGLSLFWSISDNQSFCSRRLLSTGLDPSCSSFFILFARIEHEVSNSENVLRIFSFVLHLFTLIYIRNQIRKTLEYYDQRTTSLSDYSLLIKNLPLKKGIQKNITDFIHNHFKQHWDQLKYKYKKEQFQNQIKVKKIILLPDLEEFYKLQEEKYKVIEEKKKQVIKQVVDKQQIKKLNLLIQEKQQKIKAYCAQSGRLAQNDELQSQQAIIILNSQFFKETVVQQAQQSSFDSKAVSQYFGQIQEQIQIIQAPEPKEIIWKNVNYSPKKRFGRIVMGWFFSTAFLTVVTIIFYFMLRAKTIFLDEALQQQIHQPQSEIAQEHKRSALALVYIIIILIILFNKLLMGWVLHYFAHIQKHYSTSDEQFSFCLKYTLGLFFTTALMTLAVEVVSFQNFYTHPYGVIQEEGIMFFMNAFFIQIIWLINPWQLFVVIKRKLKQGNKDMTQREANELMEDIEYTVGKRYAQIIQTMWFTFLYSTLIPVGSFLTIIGISLYYWIDKVNLLRRTSLKSNLSGDMTLFSLKLLDMTLFFRVIGQIIFDTQIRNGVNIESLVFCGIAVLYLVIPIDSLLDYFHDQKFRLQQKSYDQVKYDFIQTYATLHPILSKNSIKTMKRVNRLASKILTIEQWQNKPNKNEFNQTAQNLISDNIENISSKQQNQSRFLELTPVKLKPTYQEQQEHNQEQS